ncbi:MAG: aminomethyltransferase beta-barrel domain-containing protein, partial [Candidatus Magasanikiibacteriota bacterium]
SKPLYIVGKDFEKNKLVVGYEDDPLLYKKEIVVEDVNWIGQEPKFPLKCKVRMRHRQKMQNVIIKKAKNQENKKTVIVMFEKIERAVTPGQFAVFYKDNECLGGGVVK